MALLRFMERVTRVLTPIGLGALLIMMVAVVINVVGRALFRAPLYGTVEIVEITGTFLISFIAVYTQFKRGNISVGIVVDQMPPRAQGIIGIFGLLLCVGIVAVLAWAAFINAENMVRTNELTGIFEVPKYPLRYVWVFGLLVLWVMFLVHLIESLVKGVQK